MSMNIKERASKLKTDIPAVFLALKKKETPKSVFMECQAQSEGMWQNGKPEKWYYAIPFVLIWVAVITLIVVMFI